MRGILRGRHCGGLVPGCSVSSEIVVSAGELVRMAPPRGGERWQEGQVLLLLVLLPLLCFLTVRWREAWEGRLFGVEGSEEGGCGFEENKRGGSSSSHASAEVR